MSDDIRDDVAKRYTELLNESTSCCGETRCCGEVATLAGYTKEEIDLADAPTSFGCGNPLAFAGVREGQTVVDLGSGAGLDLLIAAEKVGPTGRVIGVDMTEAMLERAREATADRDNVELRQGFIEALPVEDGSVDWVISNCVINLSPDKAAVFGEIARVLRPGGRISISDIVVADLPDWIRQNMEAYVACVAGAISEEEYLHGLREAGLEEVAVEERLIYSGTQILGMVEGELGASLPRELVAQALPLLEGKVWSARFSGRRPEQSP